MVQLGMNINAHPQSLNGRPTQPAALKGAKWVRMVFMVHAAVDLHAAGQQNLFNNDLIQAFAHYDGLIAAYAQVGMRTLLVINQETFAQGAPWPPWGDGSDAAWGDYANGLAAISGQIAAHYRGQGVAYEIWNEGDFLGGSSIFVPPDQFAIVLSKVVAAIKAQDPDAVTVFGGMFNAPQNSVEYLNVVRSSLGGTLPVDAVGIHPYGKFPPPWKSIDDIQDELQGGWFDSLALHMSVLAKGIPDKPLWITEVGLSEHVPTPESEWPAAAKYMTGVVSFIHSKYAHRVPVLIWFAWSDVLRNAGIVDAQSQPKGPIFDTFFELAIALEKAAPVEVGKPAVTRRGVILRAVDDLSVRAGPSTDDARLTVVDADTALVALEHPLVVADKVGQDEQWLNVRTPDGTTGWSAAWFLALAGVILTPTDSLNVRSGPSTAHQAVALVKTADTLQALEPLEVVAAKIGVEDQWIEIQTAGGVKGFVAAWFLEPLSTEPAPAPEPAVQPAESVELEDDDLGSVPLEDFELPADELEPLPMEELEPPADDLSDDDLPDDDLPDDDLPPLEDFELPADELAPPLEDFELSADELAPLLEDFELPADMLTDDDLPPLEDFELPADELAPLLEDFVDLSEEPSTSAAEAILLTPTFDLNVREGPGTDHDIIDEAMPGDQLAALDPPEVTMANLGINGQWIRVQTPSGQDGWVAAWFVALAPPESPGIPAALPEDADSAPMTALAITELLLTPLEGINVREGPSTDHDVIDGVWPGDRLESLESLEVSMAKLGSAGKWLNIRTPKGHNGWAAAWLVRRATADELEEAPPAPASEIEPAPTDEVPTDEAPPVDLAPAEIPVEDVPDFEEEVPADVSGDASGEKAEPAPSFEEVPAEPEAILLTPKEGLNVRAGPSTEHAIIDAVSAGDRLEPLENRDDMLGKLSIPGRWLNVLTPRRRAGWVAAWLVRQAEPGELRPGPWVGRITVKESEILALTPTSDDLNVRGGPDTHYASLGFFNPGQRFDALEDAATIRAKLKDGKNWVRLRQPDGQEGWTAGWLLREMSGQEMADSPPIPALPKPDPSQVPDDPELGRQRAMSFDHEPCFVRLPVCDVSAIEDFSGFGPNNFSYRTYRQDPDGGGIYKNIGGLHSGLDFGIPLRTKLCSMDWGRVVYAGPNVRGRGYGAGPFNVIVRYGQTVALFGHLTEEGVAVQKDDIVGPGDPIGLSWTFNNYPHLHFEMRRYPPDYVDKLRSQAEAQDVPDVLLHMNQAFHQWGWSPLTDDHWINPAPFFNPTLESYFDELVLGHAASEAVDRLNNGFPDRVIRAGETVATAYDLYALGSIPPRRPHFWEGSHTG